MSQSPELLRRLLRAKDRIDAAPEHDWTVAQLAEISAVTVAHFAREFKKAFGLPPHRYVLTRRIERALALLRETDLAVTEIAWQTGWNSLGTFSRIFRDITGHSPQQLRQQASSSELTPQRLPECHFRAAQRPDLKIAVLEKRRQNALAKIEAPNQDQSGRQPEDL